MTETGGKHSGTEHASDFLSENLRRAYSPTGHGDQVSSLPQSDTLLQNEALLSLMASDTLMLDTMSTRSTDNTAATAVQITDFDYFDWDMDGPLPLNASNSSVVTNDIDRELPRRHSEHLAIAANIVPAHPTISLAARSPPARSRSEPLSSPGLEGHNEDANHASIRPATSQRPSRKDSGMSQAVSSSPNRPTPAVYYHARVKEEQHDAPSSEEQTMDSTSAQTNMSGEAEQSNSLPSDLEPLDFDAAVGSRWKQQQNRTKSFVDDIMTELAQLAADTQLWASLKIIEIDEQGHERLGEQIEQIDRMEESDHRARQALNNFAQLTRIALDNVRFIDDCL